MNIREKRSPELIREYFNLLRWKKNGCEIDLKQDFVNSYIASSESLILIKRQILAITESIESSKNSILLHQKSKVEIESQLDQLSRQILARREEIDTIKGEIRSIQDEMEALNPQFSVKEDVKTSQKTSNLKFEEALWVLTASILNDLKDLFFKLIKYIKRLFRNPSASKLEILIFILVILTLVSAVKIIFSSKFIFIIPASIFITLGFLVIKEWSQIDRENRRNEQENLLRIEAERQQREEALRKIEAKRINLQHKRQELKNDLIYAEDVYKNLVKFRQKLVTQKQLYETNISIKKGEIVELEQLQQQKEREYQDTSNALVNALEEQEREKKENRLSELESKVKDWLSSDIRRLENKAMKRLKIMPANHISERNTLQNEQLRILIGVTERTSNNSVVESDSDRSLESYNEELYIESRDFESEPSKDGKRMYGVYEFLVIFLCSNFLSYYRCYLNFIRGKTVNEEFCEYLYDSIVSIKLQEKSSVRLKDESQRNVYGKRLLLSTKDGKVVCFRISRHKIDGTHSLKLSQIDEAAIAIRDMLRQRRVDNVMLVDNLNDDWV